MRLLDLPDDVLQSVLAHVPLREFPHLRSVSTDFRRLVDDTLLLYAHADRSVRKQAVLRRLCIAVRNHVPDEIRPFLPDGSAVGMTMQFREFDVYDPWIQRYRYGFHGFHQCAGVTWDVEKEPRGDYTLQASLDLGHGMHTACIHIGIRPSVHFHCSPLSSSVELFLFASLLALHTSLRQSQPRVDDLLFEYHHRMDQAYMRLLHDLVPGSNGEVSLATIAYAERHIEALVSLKIRSFV